MSEAWWELEDQVHLPSRPAPGPMLLLQKGRYEFRDPSRLPEDGFRFVWKLANGKLQARGPARIDHLDDIITLVKLGAAKGWDVTLIP